MPPQRSSLSGFAASIAFLLAATSTSAGVVLNDTMSRTSRTATPSATGAQWFRIGPDPGYSVTYAPSDLRMTHSSGSGGQLLGYLTSSGGSPVSLAINEFVKATFTFSLVGSFGTATGNTAFRIGLFNTGNQRITTDITGASADGKFSAYTGYAAMMSPTTTSGISIWRRVPNAASNKENLIGTTGVYTGPLASGASQVLQANVNYTGVLTVTRFASGTEFRISVSGAGLNSYELAYVDTDSTKQVQSFDAIAFGWVTGLVQANGGLAVRNLKIEKSALSPTDPLANSDPGRPFIWVRNAEKSGILAKISAQPWAQSVRTGMINRVATNVTNHQNNRDTFLRGNGTITFPGLPVDWSTGKYRTMTNTSDPDGVRSKSTSKFNAALDCAVLYYLTGETKYAQFAADVLHNVVKTLLPVAPSADTGNGGWIIRNDLLLEARVLGTQLPVVYDFIRTFLESNKVYDVMTGGLTDFNYYQAQQYFRTYYELVCDHGNNTNNWSALESTCMLNNLLALSDPAERAAGLNVYLTNGTPQQASLNNDYSDYPQPDSIWPESLQYASAVGSIRSTHMVLLERYDPTLKLFNAYPNYPLSLSRISYLRYPNGEQISFGDGGRKTGGEPYFDYEIMYQHARAIGRQDLVAHFGAAIKRGMDAGKHNRETLLAYEDLDMHNEPLQLLWFNPDVAEASVPQVFPTTDQVAHAGITLQRNLSPAGALYGLMGFVGGAAHTHSHASGMSMELYGAGHVLGAKSGKSDYTSDLHENYYRLFASNNTIIVNGASRGEGGWAEVAINKVATAALEPAVARAPVSPNHSFTTSTFIDDKGSAAEATQQRTLGIVRTSPTTGYYVDIFRSDSTLANEYHDYIYRNVGDSVTLETDSGPLALTSAPNRFASDIGDAYQQPGWRYFTDTEVSAATNAGVTANFSAMITNNWRQMRMYMPGSSGREYARVTSPPIVEAPTPYHTQRAPAVVIRKYGNAWDQPFAAVFEPHLGAPGSGTVKTVSTLSTNGVVVGLQVGSTVNGRNLVQYVLSNPNATDVFTDSTRGLSFKGRYAVVTDNGDGSGSLYLGQGSSLSFKGNSVASSSGANTQAYVEFTVGQPSVVKSNQPVIVQTPPTITVPATAAGTYGAAFSVTVSATGQPAPTLSVASTLPPGLQFNGATGTLSGTPTAAGNYSVQFVATNAAGSATGTLSLSIAKASATVVPQNLEQTYTGQPLSPTAVTAPSNLPVVFTYANNATHTDAGSYAVTAMVDSPNYEGAATGTLVVAKAPATIAFSNPTQTYDGSAKSVTLTTTPVGLTTTLTYGGSANPPKNAGSYPLVATITESNYTGSATDTLQVGKASASLSFANTSQTYDGAPKAVTVSTSPTDLTYSLTYNGSATAPVNAGSYVLDAAITDSNYAGSLTGSLAIEQAVQAITFNPVPGVTFGEAPFTVNATSNSGLAVAFSMVSGPATIVGNTVTITGAGPVVVRAAQPGDANYAAAPDVDQSFTVGKANQAIAFGAISGVTFGDVPFALSATSDSGLPVAFSVVSGPASLSDSTLTITGAGPVVVRASQAGNVNYNPAPNVEQTFTVGKANQAITFAALGDKTYGDAAFTVSATSNSGLPVTFSVANGPATISGNTVTVTGAGTVIVRASQAGDSNTNAAPNVDRTFAVGKATLAVTAIDATRAFGMADPVFAVTYAGFVGADTAATLVTAPVATTTATAASNVGTYPITASGGVDANYALSYVAGSLVITPASATVALAGVNGVYSGTPQSATATTVPVGLSVGFTYNGAATAPTNAGTYTVLATITDPNYSGLASGSFTIDQAVVPVELSNLNQVYDGAPKSVTATTTPAGLTVNVTYNGSATAPTEAGSYPVVASISDLNYRGSTSATLVVAPSTAAAIVIGNLTQVYDGMPKPVTATTTPAGLTTTITYGGSTTAPTIPGTYPVVVSISNPNYTATVTGNLVIAVTALVRHAPTLDGDIEGSVQVLTGESLALNGNASVSGDILVPGLPTVRLNGQPTFVGTKDGTGSAAPSNYQVTLNGKAVLRYLVRRVDPIAMPTVSAPPAPTGTRDVEITKAGQSLGSLATLRNVVINDKAGTIALPAGTYGTLTADGSTALQLGVAGATTPSVYNLQGLTMNGKSQLKVVGPVVLVLARSASIDGEVIGTGSPAWLTLGVASGGVTLNGNVSFMGTIVAPNGTVTINGNASLNGSVIADRLTVNGNGLLKQGTP